MTSSTKHLQSYIEAILRVYNLHGRRDNKYKARIKILVGALGIDEFRRQVDAEWQHLKSDELDMNRLAEIAALFKHGEYDADAAAYTAHNDRAATDTAFANWLHHNVIEHKAPGYNIVHVSVKRKDLPPGDLFTHQFHAIADIMDKYSRGYCNVVYDQICTSLRTQRRPRDCIRPARSDKLATANRHTLQDMICCPGLDFCSLANAASIPVAKAITERFDDLDELYDLGRIDIKMSGCINACGHHHVGDIGILGIDKRGEEYYQIAIGGSPGQNDVDIARVAKYSGPPWPKNVSFGLSNAS